MAGLRAQPDVSVDLISNTKRGILRYPEVFWKLLKYRFNNKTDAYLVTFRGYELLLMMVLSFVRTPIVFDEFINFTEWMAEHHKIRPGTLSYRLFRRWYGWLANTSRLILADTESHADYSAELNHIERTRYLSIPVGTDETMFFPEEIQKAASQPFSVFYYGSMLPLHGLDYVLKAAIKLQDEPGITFRFVGGGTAIRQSCEVAAARGARVSYEAWLPFEQIPQAAREAGLCLGGPFGDTLQSQFVVTGKTYQFLALSVPVLVGQNLESNLFKDKDNALVVPQADAEALAAAIRWAYNNPKKLAVVAEGGRKLYEAHFSQRRVNEGVRTLVDRLLEAGK